MSVRVEKNLIKKKVNTGNCFVEKLLLIFIPALKPR